MLGLLSLIIMFRWYWLVWITLLQKKKRPSLRISFDFFQALIVETNRFIKLITEKIFRSKSFSIFRSFNFYFRKCWCFKFVKVLFAYFLQFFQTSFVFTEYFGFCFVSLFTVDYLQGQISISFCLPWFILANNVLFGFLCHPLYSFDLWCLL